MFIDAKWNDVALRQEGNVYSDQVRRCRPPSGGQCL